MLANVISAVAAVLNCLLNTFFIKTAAAAAAAADFIRFPGLALEIYIRVIIKPKKNFTCIRMFTASCL